MRFKESGSCHIYYGTERIDARPIQACIDDTVSLNGLYFTLNPEVLNGRDKINFQVKDIYDLGSVLLMRDIFHSRESHLVQVYL